MMQRVRYIVSTRFGLDVRVTLDDILKPDVREIKFAKLPATWVYISGPNAFIATGEAACKKR